MKAFLFGLIVGLICGAIGYRYYQTTYTQNNPEFAAKVEKAKIAALDVIGKADKTKEGASNLSPNAPQ